MKSPLNPMKITIKLPLIHHWLLLPKTHEEPGELVLYTRRAVEPPLFQAVWGRPKSEAPPALVVVVAAWWDWMGLSKKLLWKHRKRVV